MTTRLELMGDPGPWRDAEKFVSAVRAYNPALTEQQVVAIVRRENAKHRPRHQNMSFHLFGADIMTDDLPSIDAWMYLPRDWKRELPAYPMVGGVVIDHEAPGAAVALSNARAGRSSVNRASWIFPVGLSKTYAWCKQNAFIQEVADADVEVIRKSSFRLWFRNPDMADGALQIHRYDYAPTETFSFAKMDDLAAFDRDQQRAKQWKGV